VDLLSSSSWTEYLAGASSMTDLAAGLRGSAADRLLLAAPVMSSMAWGALRALASAPHLSSGHVGALT